MDIKGQRGIQSSPAWLITVFYCFEETTNNYKATDRLLGGVVDGFITLYFTLNVEGGHLHLK